jgi:hypothetical protein
LPSWSVKTERKKAAAHHRREPKRASPSAYTGSVTVHDNNWHWGQTTIIHSANTRVAAIEAATIGLAGNRTGLADMARGVVKFFNAQKGYGFIVPERKIGIAD